MPDLFIVFVPKRICFPEMRTSFDLVPITVWAKMTETESETFNRVSLSLLQKGGLVC